MNKSTHKAEVVEVKLNPHPNADSLSLVNLFGGYQVCVRTADWKDGMLGVYIPPDSVVDSARPEFSFLAGHERIKVKKLRGIVSMGLLIPAPEGSKVGDDLAEHFGIIHYEPQELITGGEATKAPEGYFPIYDVDSLRRYAEVFIPGEPVWITEKIHGSSSRFVYAGGEIHAGSRKEWKKFDKTNMWWRIIEQYPEIQSLCEANPGVTVYGEVFGAVQSLKYGTKPGELKFAAFDILHGSTWLNPQDARNLASDIPWVPLIGDREPFDLERILELAEGKTLIPGADHVREGVVVKPIIERTHPSIGRVNLKVVGNGYLEKS